MKDENRTSDNPVQDLLHAVVVRAADDYREANVKMIMKPSNYNARKTAKECRAFFLSPEFSAYTTVEGAFILEKLDQETQYILEAAAITHDIACPFIRDEFGHTNHKRQETEGAVMVRDFLASLPEDQLDRIAYLVGHHHTLNNIDGADYQILVEADLIMNACEKGWKLDSIFPILRTDAGKRIASAVLPAD